MSAEPTALLASIIANPEADGPRIEYADLLARSDLSPERARGEFIHLQLALSRLSESDPEWPRRIARESELLGSFRDTWEKPLRDLMTPIGSSVFSRWLKSRFGRRGGHWGYHRGFVEFILAPARAFLGEDVKLLSVSPVRRLVLSHASLHIEELATDTRLAGLKSLHLVGDMEDDEDLELLSSRARATGLKVIEFGLPRLWPNEEELFEAIRSDRLAELETMPAWALADGPSRERLTELAVHRSLSVHKHDPAWEGEWLARSEWVYLGRELREFGAWAVVKSHHDGDDERGVCRRLILARPEQAGRLAEIAAQLGRVWN